MTPKEDYGVVGTYDAGTVTFGGGNPSDRDPAMDMVVIDEWIYNQLVHDMALTGLLQGFTPSSEGEIYGDTVPVDVKFPYIIYHLQAPGVDRMTLEGDLVLNRSLWTVKVVDRSESYQTIKFVYSRVHQLLHKASGIVADGVVLHSRRVQTIHYPELRESVDYRHLGGIYQIYV